MSKQVLFKDVTDEQFLKEFMKRFQCDGAVFIYLDSGDEFAFGKWSNGTGKNWVNSVFTAVKEKVYLQLDKSRIKENVYLNLSERN